MKPDATEIKRRGLELLLRSKNLADDEGCNAYCTSLSTYCIAMHFSGTHDQHSRTMFKNAIDALDRAVVRYDNGLYPMMNSRDKVLVEKISQMIEQWLREGRMHVTAIERAERATEIMNQVPA